MGSRQNQELGVPNFAGGQCSGKGVSTLADNEFAVMDNVVLKPAGSGFRSREGNTELNASAIASGEPITGLGYFETLPGVEYIVATAGTGIYADQSIDGTFTDITGSVTITNGQDNFWNIFQVGDKLIGVGGNANAPWKYTGTGNASALGGTPPNGRYGFQYGNRTFIMNTAADPSTIYWSVLLDPEDWSGDGSGNASVEPNDGDYLVTAAPLNLNSVLLFKRNSVFLMTGRESPFPIFPLFKGIGCVGQHACVVNEGLAYFITSDAKMAVTDGNEILQMQHLPDLDDVWRSFRPFRLPYIQGQVINGPDFDWIVWSATKSDADTNDYAAIWDLRNRCWLTASTGFEANAFVATTDKVYYMGGYDGKVYRLIAPTTYTDASNGDAAVSWTVESDWRTLKGLLDVKQVNRANFVHMTRATGTSTFSYGYDYASTLSTKTFSMATSGASLWDTAQWDISTWDGYTGRITNVFLQGRGNSFKWRLSGSSEISYDFSSVTIFGNNKSQRNFNAGQ